jgi:septal ring-binding cell division protein DamX
MEENNKVIVFEKKEIVLILIFVVVLIITSFTMGISLGKKLGLADAGVTEADEKTVTLKSGLEEDVDKTVEEDSKLTDEEKLRKLMDEQQNLLKDNLEKVSSEEPAMSTNQSVEPKSSNAMAGKFTIQLGSYPTLEEAKQFAEGFSVRGYSPIINETQLEGKGTWYRVSLGLFNTVDEAKTYIKGEQSLFSGQDYVITEIK